MSDYLISDAERRWAVRACWWSPLLGLVAWLLTARFLLFLIYLQSPGWNWKAALVLGSAAALFPWVWLLGIELDRRWKAGHYAAIPVGAFLAIGMVVAANSALQLPRGRALINEWILVRTDYFSYDNNTFIWERRAFPTSGFPEPSANKIGLIGSSQINQGLNEQQLAKELPGWQVEKNCLPGMAPMQYGMLQDRIDERQFKVVVTMWSEFDIFRDDTIPTNRLRWCSNPPGVNNLAYAVGTVSLFWANRGEFADLQLAAWIPSWRRRDQFRRALFGQWWNVRREEAPGPDQAMLGMINLDLDYGREQLRNNVRRSKLVDANFNALAQFAHHLHESGTQLVVLEGSVHPDASDAYDRQFRLETHARLVELAQRAKFRFVPASRQPELTEADYLDATHLNEQGRTRLTAALANYLLGQQVIPNPGNVMVSSSEPVPQP